MSVSILTGDCLALMPTLDADSVDAIVSDPPYGLSFMGKGWDHAVPGVEFWREALRVAKPGAHLAAFGGTRTYHRLTCAIEDAGWEIRDCLSWLYGSGFPKSRDIGKDMDKGLRPVIGTQDAPGHAKANVEQGAQSRTHTTFPKYSADPVTDLARQWQGWGTALKPAWEPIILARKPLGGTVAANVLRHATGALNIDGCRIPTDDVVGASGRWGFTEGKGWNANSVPSATSDRFEHTKGRWPANVVLDEDAAAVLDEATDGLQSSKGGYVRKHGGAQLLGAMSGGRTDEPTGLSDTGGASRFFYTAKASRSERNAGLESFAEKPAGAVKSGDGGFRNEEARGRKPRHDAQLVARNHHPTVKPLALMQWLCRLVTPKGGLILDPFCGSGTTGRAAIAEGFRFLGMELSPEYAEIARARIRDYAPLFADGAA